jgi:hypothetical protein
MILLLEWPKQNEIRKRQFLDSRIETCFLYFVIVFFTRFVISEMIFISAYLVATCFYFLFCQRLSV